MGFFDTKMTAKRNWYWWRFHRNGDNLDTQTTT